MQRVNPLDNGRTGAYNEYIVPPHFHQDLPVENAVFLLFFAISSSLLWVTRVYTPEIYRQKCTALFEHVYESYPERDKGVYSMVA